MKKGVSVLIFIMTFILQSCAQLNLGSVVETTPNTGNESSSSSSTLGNILGNILASDDVGLSDLSGTWKYSGPAVGFQSDDILKSIGGSAASTAIESELEAYYNKLGFNNVVLTIDENANFTMKIQYITLNGVVEKGNNGIFVFNFKALGGINIGKLNVYTTLSGKTLSLTCDAKKFVELVRKITTITNNSTMQSVTSLLESYDGITVGFKLKKQ